ncbi:hypothetical protein KFE25_010594 [Diacronema lutheri]|uniref:tRNA (guanine(9)-N(1))-methyltransferase n=1 Tax=Diacronema lutheri TaxID=2081491 RepID=A0A8J6C456_DIALT|nr:hypothetical protein KFE25_010594 [Diacronema lutheri]
MRQGAFVFIEAQDCRTGAMLTLFCTSPPLADLAAELSGARPHLGPSAIVSARGVVEPPRRRHVIARRAAPPPAADGASDEVRRAVPGSADAAPRSAGGLADALHEARWRHDALSRCASQADEQPRPTIACRTLEVLYPARAHVPRDLLPPVPCIAFDLAYFDAMNELEVKALGRQLLLCYTAVRHQARPFNIALCGMPADEPAVTDAPAATDEPAATDAPAAMGAPAEQRTAQGGCGRRGARARAERAGTSSFSEACAARGLVAAGRALLQAELASFGLAQWATLPSTERLPWEVWSPSECVYLTSEAEEELDDVKGALVYVVGGLVDHKEKPAFSLARAQAHGVRTAKLPLGRFVKMRKPALSTSAVVQMLMLQHELRDWALAVRLCPAMHVAPLRKYVHWLKPEIDAPPRARAPSAPAVADDAEDEGAPSAESGRTSPDS